MIEPHQRSAPRLLPYVLLLSYTLPFAWPVLGAYFSGDDLMNLNYHRYQNPPWRAISDTVMFWTSYRRPLGGVVYLGLYEAFGLGHALPYYLTGLAIFLANTALTFGLALRLTRSSQTAVIAAAIACLHVETIDVLYNFGAVYELLACGFMLAAFHAYLTAAAASASRQRWWYGAAVVCFILALGGKEMAITLPGILLAYELIYQSRASISATTLLHTVLRILPFIIVSVMCAAGKLLGANALWRDNDAYLSALDWTALHNLGLYLAKLVLHQDPIGVQTTLGIVLGLIGLALAMRNRLMVFGWCWFVIALTPIIGLPRNWGLFLYIPTIGAGFYVAALLNALGQFLGSLSRRLSTPLAGWIAVLLVLGLMARVQYGPYLEAAHNLFLDAGKRQAADMRQVFARFPRLTTDDALLFLTSPYGDKWGLQFSIWLRYDNPAIEVYGGPNMDVDAFKRAVAQGKTPHVLDYRDGTLIELPFSAISAVRTAVSSGFVADTR